MLRHLRRWLPVDLILIGLIFGGLSAGITLTTNAYRSPMHDIARVLCIAAYIAIFLGLFCLRFSGKKRSN